MEVVLENWRTTRSKDLHEPNLNCLRVTHLFSAIHCVFVQQAFKGEASHLFIKGIECHF